MEAIKNGKHMGSYRYLRQYRKLKTMTWINFDKKELLFSLGHILYSQWVL